MATEWDRATMQNQVPRTASDVRAILAQAGISLRRSLGQHYLVDPNLRAALVRDAGLAPGEVVLEVGVGLGILTAGLLEAGAVVLGVELDETVLALSRRLLAPHLIETPETNGVPDCAALADNLLAARRAGQGRVALLHANAIQRKQLAPEMVACLEALRQRAPADAPAACPLRLVANLPYQIASPLLISLLEWRPTSSSDHDAGTDAERVRGIDGFAVMVQWEVAQRLVAQPGSEMYGALSVLVQAHAETRFTRRIAPSVFVPRPKVDSGFVLGLARSPQARFPLGLDAIGYELFKRTVHAAFQYRRKHLHKALSHGLGRASQEVHAACEATGLDAHSRGETLSPAEFADLARALRQQEVG